MSALGLDAAAGLPQEEQPWRRAVKRLVRRRGALVGGRGDGLLDAINRPAVLSSPHICASSFGSFDGAAPPRDMVMRQAADTAVIVYTSGTTGQPKGAELTHIQLYMNADIPGRLFDVQADDVVITVLPLFHVFGLSSILDVCVRFGCKLSAMLITLPLLLPEPVEHPPLPEG